MREARVARIQLACFLLLLTGLLGYKCSGGGGNQAVVSLVPDATAVGTNSAFLVEIAVNSPVSIQAFEMGLRWDPAMLSAIHVLPHPEFDDDGRFFTNPLWNSSAGRLDRVVDLRHGEPGVAGSFKVATVWFTSRGSAGDTSIQFSRGGLAEGDGSEPPVRAVPVTITIQP